MENNDNNNEDNFPFTDLFAPLEKIIDDFDRFFSGFSTVFTIPSTQDSQPTGNLRDEVLKQDDHVGDEILDSTIEQNGLFNRTFSSSSVITSIQRETTPSGQCVIEKKIQRNDRNQTETQSKICGDKYHTTIKQDGKIIREYGNSTLEELNQIDSQSSPTLGGDKHSDFFKRIFSSK